MRGVSAWLRWQEWRSRAVARGEGGEAGRVGCCLRRFPFASKNRELQIMRKLDHCNIVRLRYFFYSSGEKVRPWVCGGVLHPCSCLPFPCDCQSFPRYPHEPSLPFPTPFLTVPHTSPLHSAERRALSKSGAGIRARDSVPGGPPFHQGQVDHPYHLCQGGQAGRQAVGTQAYKARDPGSSCLLWVPSSSRFMLLSADFALPVLVSITAIDGACPVLGRAP